MIDVLNKLANKGFKLWFAVIGLIILYAVISSSFDDTPQQVKDAKTDLFLAYSSSIYEQSVCDTKDFDGTWIILCHPRGTASGGLYEVSYKESSPAYVLSAINGKAQQHLPKLQLVGTVKKNGKVHPADAMEAFRSDIEG
ncbi:hypothetical protein ABZX01_003805 [Vibrio vulnificus]|nr:hypothetical protein [Ketobacter sp.]